MVEERLYRGFCRPEEELAAPIGLFQEEKTSIYALFQTFSPLNEKYRKRALGYLDDFYRILDNPKRARRAFTVTCRDM
jgi:hypothetical protein